MNEYSLNQIKKAALHGQISAQTVYPVNENDSFSQFVYVEKHHTEQKQKALILAIAAVAVVHIGLWYVSKQLPTAQLDIKKPDPVVIEIVKPPEPSKVIEPKIPPVTQKPKIPPVSQKPQPVQKQLAPPNPVQKSVEQPKSIQQNKTAEQVKPIAEPLSKNVVAAPVQQPISKSSDVATKPNDDNQVVTEAKGYAGYLSNPAPEYPEQALDRGWEGSVMLRVKVLPNGSPDTVTIKESSGKKILDNAAVRTVKQWKFSPALKGKTPVEGWVDVPIHYRLPK